MLLALALLGSSAETSVSSSPQREAKVGHFLVTSADFFSHGSE